MLEFLLGACFFLCIFAPFTFVIFLGMLRALLRLGRRL